MLIYNVKMVKLSLYKYTNHYKFIFAISCILITSPLVAQVGFVNKTEIEFSNGSGWVSNGSISTPSMLAKKPILLRSGFTVEELLESASASFYQEFTTRDEMIAAIESRMIGMISSFGYVPDEDTGWVVCDGSEYPGFINQELANLLQTTYGGSGTTNGNGDFEGTYKVPDLRGLFIMGTVDTDLITTTNITTSTPYHQHTIEAGSVINSGNHNSETHTHDVYSLLASIMLVDDDENDSPGVYGSTNTSIPDTSQTTTLHSHNIPNLSLTYADALGALTENRPINAAVVYCIYAGSQE